MTRKELESMYIEKEGMIFTPRYTFTSYDPETGVYEGLEIQATAEQVYQEWKNKDKQIDICPTKTTEEKLEELMKEYNDLKSRTSNIEETIMGIMTEI